MRKGGKRKASQKEEATENNKNKAVTRAKRTIAPKPQSETVYLSEKRNLVFTEFDWEFDEVEEFTDKLIEEELSVDQKDAFKDFLKEKVREAKRANREAREARKNAIEEMRGETKTAFENMKFYKFYPVASPDTPDVSDVKSPFINRYYGKAHKVL